VQYILQLTKLIVTCTCDLSNSCSTDSSNIAWAWRRFQPLCTEITIVLHSRQNLNPNFVLNAFLVPRHHGWVRPWQVVSDNS